MDKDQWRTSKDLRRSTIMSHEEMMFINDAIALLNDNIGRMQTYYTRWNLEEEAYCSDQETKPKLPNSRMNIINAAVEGEVTQIVNPNLAIMASGVSPEDEEFSNWAKIGLDWAFKQNKIPKKLTEHERRRNKLGEAWFKVVWDEAFAGGQGLPLIKVPPLNKIFVDIKVASYLDLDDAEYIAETINLSRSYAELTYGEEKAAVIDYGLNQYKDNGVFYEADSGIDERGWTLIQWWSKDKGILRLQEFSACGVLLYDSHKSGDRKTQDKESTEEVKPFYKYVNNKYPYFLTPKYTEEGKLHGFGDAKLLLALQNCVNEIWDKIRIQLRPNIILVDSNSNIDIATWNDNSFDPVYYDGTKIRGQVPIYSVAWGALSADIWKMLENLHTEAQRIIRFSDLMTGQQGTTQTATEAAIQQSQGNSHSEHEKMIIESTLADVATYMLALMMEFFKGAKAFRISGDQAKYEWVDFKKMTQVPALMPASSGYLESYQKSNPQAPTPEWEHVKDESGKPIKKSVEMDIEVSVGSGLPKNKAFVWQMIEKLGQMMGVDTSSGQPVQKPLLDYKELREFIKTYLGIPIQDEDEMEKFMQQFRQKQQQPTSGIPGTTPGAATSPMPNPMQPGQASNEGIGPGGGVTTPSPQEGSVTGGNGQTA